MVTKKRSSLLILEDNPDQIKLYRLQLKNLYGLTFAENYDEALVLAKNPFFDTAIVDIVLNGYKKSGKDFIEHLRNVEHSNLPAIAVTAVESSGFRNIFLDAGFNDYLSKPYFLGDLVKSIENLVLEK